MQVWTRGKPGSADISDYLALVHPLADPHALVNLRQVSVIGLIAVSMPDDDQVSVLSPAAGKKNCSIARSRNRRSRCRRIIEALMRAVDFEDRMESPPRKE